MTEQNLTRGKLLEKKFKTRKYRDRIFKIGKISFTNQYSYFIPILETSHYFFSIIYIEPEKKTRFNQPVLYKISHPQFLRW